MTKRRRFQVVLALLMGAMGLATPRRTEAAVPICGPVCDDDCLFGQQDCGFMSCVPLSCSGGSQYLCQNQVIINCGSV